MEAAPDWEVVLAVWVEEDATEDEEEDCFVIVATELVPVPVPVGVLVPVLLPVGEDAGDEVVDVPFPPPVVVPFPGAP